MLKGVFLMQVQGQMDWAGLLAEATQAAGLLAPGSGEVSVSMPG